MVSKIRNRQKTEWGLWTESSREMPFSEISTQELKTPANPSPLLVDFFARFVKRWSRKRPAARLLPNKARPPGAGSFALLRVVRRRRDETVGYLCLRFVDKRDKPNLF